MDPLKLNDPEIRAELTRQANEDNLRGMLFSACYGACKKVTQNMLDQMAKQGGVPGDLAVEMMHVGMVACAASLRMLALEHVKAPLDVVDGAERNARKVGEKIYRENWTVLSKVVKRDTGPIAPGGGLVGESGLVDLDGKKL